LITRTSPVLYLSSSLQEEQHGGSLFILTKKLVVHGAATAIQRDKSGEVTVQAWDRRELSRLEVLETDDRKAFDPGYRQVPYLRLRLTYQRGQSITLPLGNRPGMPAHRSIEEVFPHFLEDLTQRD